MKKTILLGIFFLLVLATFATASDLIVSDVTLGSLTDEERYNSEESDIDGIVSGSINITNNGTSAITSLTLSHTVPGGYSFSIGTYSDTIPAGDSIEVTVNAVVPEDFDAIESDFSNHKPNIGQINIQGNNGTNNVSESSDAYMQAKNELVIKKITLYRDSVDGEKLGSLGSDEDGLINDDSDDEVKPGDKLVLVVEVKNDFDEDDYDLDIDANIKIRDYDDDDFEFDEDEDDDEIKAEETVEFIFDIEVDKDTDSDDYSFDIEVDGDDDNDAKHGEKKTIEISVSKEKHDVIIKTAELLPETVSCDRDVRLEVELENIGKNDEDEIVLLVECEDLDYRKPIKNIDIEEDETDEETFYMVIGDDVKADSYLCEVKVYLDYDDYEDDEPNDDEGLLLIVKDCVVTPPAEEEEEEEEEEPIVIQPTQPTTPTGGVVYGQPVSEIEDFFESNAYIALLAVGALIGIALLFLAIAIIVRR